MTKSKLTLAIGIPFIIVIVGIMIWMNCTDKLDNGWSSIFEVFASTALSFCILLVYVKQYEAERNRELPQLRLEENVERIGLNDVYKTQLINDGPAFKRLNSIDLYNVLELQISQQTDKGKTFILDAYYMPIALTGLNLMPTGKQQGTIAYYDSTMFSNDGYTKLINEQMEKKHIRCKDGISMAPYFWRYLIISYEDFEGNNHKEYLLPYFNLSETVYKKRKKESERLFRKPVEIGNVCDSLMNVCGRYLLSDTLSHDNTTE